MNESVGFIMVALGSHRSQLALFRKFQTASVQIEDPLRKVVNNAPGVICQVRSHLDGSLSIPFITPNCRTLFGLTTAEIQTNAETLISLIAVEDIDSFYQSLEVAMAKLQTWHWQGRFISLGYTRTVHLSADPELQSNGEIIWNGFLVNISTHIQNTDLALRESQQRLRLLIQQAPIAIIQWNTDFQVQKWNPAAEMTFGYRHKEVIDQHLGFLLPDTVRDEVLQQVTSLLTQSGVTRTIHESITKSGKTIICEWYNYPLIAPNGTVISIVSMVSDITDRKTAERALKLQTQQLQHTLRELRLTQTQLIQSEKMSSLGQLVAGVAHEINNPVSFISCNIPHAKQYIGVLFYLLQCYQSEFPEGTPAIASALEEIDLKFLQQDLPKTLNSIQVGAQRIQEIVLSLRNFSRLDEAAVKAVDLHEGIDSTLMILQNRLKHRLKHPDIEVIKKYADLPKIECCPGQLNQVFMNILTNAIYALDESQNLLPKIWITTELINMKVRIRIRDNGTGISAEVCDRLFDPFFTTKPVGKGTGLGMSISYQIVTEKHRGSLRCYSELGKGAEFVIEIPTSQSDSNLTAKQGAALLEKRRC
jgi:two-component system, NtrC family, sensor kinase